MIRYLEVQCSAIKISIHQSLWPPASNSKSATMWQRTRTSPPPCRKPRCLTCRLQPPMYVQFRFVVLQRHWLVGDAIFWISLQLPLCFEDWVDLGIWVCVFAKTLLLILPVASRHASQSHELSHHVQKLGGSCNHYCPPNLSICFCIKSGWTKVIQRLVYTNQCSFQLLKAIY